MPRGEINQKEKKGGTMKKINNFFGLWSCIMGAAGESAGDDPLGELLDQIFRKEYANGKDAIDWLNEELGRVKDATLKKSLKDATVNLIARTQYFYLAAGFSLGSIYDAMDPTAKDQIDYLKKRIHDGGIFPMAAKLPTK